MPTMQSVYLARLRAADESKRMRELREAEERRQRDLRRSETGDFVVGIIAALGLSIMAWIILYAWWTA